MNIFKKFSIHLLVLSLFILPVIISAQVNNPPGTTIGIRIGNPFNCGGAANCTLIDLITAVLNKIIMPIAAVGVVMYIVYAGFTYVTAQGNPTKVTAAHQRLLWSLVGAGILLGAAGISVVVQNTIKALIRP